MKNVIKDLAANEAVSWGTIAEKIDENFSELESSIPEAGGIDEEQLQEYLETNQYAKIGDIPSVPTKVSELENDEGYLTEHQSLDGYATEEWVTEKGYLTEHQSLDGLQEELVSGTNIKTINGQSILGGGNITIQGEGGSSAKSISILFVGNSLTQDGIAYLPYMLKNYYPEVDFKIYMWYIGGYTLEQQYTKFTSGGVADIFSVAENSASWTNYSKNKTMASVLSTYTFDVVCMQEYFNYKLEYSDATDWNNCRDYIVSNYTGGNALEFVSLFHAPLRSKADEVFEMTSDGNALILQETISQDMIPNGIAVYRALSTDLNSLGDKGGLSPDGTHTQEGLPCLLQTYVTLCWLFDKLSINKSVYGSPMRMTASIYNSISVPGANLGSGVVTGTDAQNLLAQELAIKAYKEGKQFTINNLSPYHNTPSVVECTFTITANLEDAVIKINGVEQSSVTVLSGSTVNWEVSKEGYITQSGSEVILEDTTKNIELIKDVVSVTAEFTQGSRTIFSNQELDDLRELLVVNASYSDGTSDVAESYSLTGELSEGTSVITVSYGGKTTTFNVNVTAFEIPEGYTRYGYIQSKSDSSGSTRELGSFIYLNTQEDYNALSMEVTLGEKPNLKISGAGILGARPASGKYYALYFKDAGLRADLRGVNVTAPYPTSRLKYTAKLDNPETSPASLRINNGEPVTVEWAEPSVISGTMSLFNNIPYGSTAKLYINHTVRIGDIIHRKANGECVGYYTPVVYEGRIGMYDQVSKEFYSSSTASATTVSNSGCYYSVGNW